MNNQVLKTCPFTGEAPKIERWTPEDGQHRDYSKSAWIVTIQSSAVSIEKASLDGGIDAENKAIAAWSTRAMPAPIPDAREGVEVVGYAADFEGQQGEVVTGLFSTNATFRQCPPDFGEPRELMTVAQHNRIASALQASAMVVPDGYALIPTESLARFPEINPENYGDDEVMALNNWAIDLVLAASPAAKGGE